MASWRRIVLLLTFLGCVSAGTLLGMLFWMTATIEQVEHSKTEALIRLKISETSETLRLGVEDYAYWTHAFNLVEDENPEAILEDLGTGATDSDLFDQLYILGANGDLLHAFDGQLGADAHSLFDAEAISPLWDALQDSEAADYASQVSVLALGDRIALVAAAWITPDSIGDTPDIRLPALIGVIQFDTHRTSALVKDVEVSTARFAPYTDGYTRNPDADTIMLHALNGAPVATLSWSMRSVGLALRRELLPSIAWVILSIGAICALAAHYFHTQYVALRQANTVATTDQLTGLMNRAGLEKVLKTKEFAESLTHGHLAAIYLDLNNFKVLNDTFGHEAGDIALRVTADRLRRAVRKTDIVVRLGGDEFLCVVFDEDPKGAALAVATRIQELVAPPISLGDHDYIITPSTGLAISSPGALWETVLSQSDAAMYCSKQRASNQPILYGNSMSASASSA